MINSFASAYHAAQKTWGLINGDQFTWDCFAFFLRPSFLICKKTKQPSNHDFPSSNRTSSWVSTAAVIHQSMCGHLDRLAPIENNIGRALSLCSGDGGHHRSGCSQKDLAAALYGR